MSNTNQYAFLNVIHLSAVEFISNCKEIQKSLSMDFLVSRLSFVPGPISHQLLNFSFSCVENQSEIGYSEPVSDPVSTCPG